MRNWTPGVFCRWKAIVGDNIKSLNAVWTVFAKDHKPLPLCNRTDKLRWRSVFLTLSPTRVSLRGKSRPYPPPPPPPRNIVYHLKLARSFKFAASVVIWICVRTPLFKQKWPTILFSWYVETRYEVLRLKMTLRVVQLFLSLRAYARENYATVESILIQFGIFVFSLLSVLRHVLSHFP